MKSEFVRARVSSELKHDSELVLAKLGMSVSDAIRIFLTQVCSGLMISDTFLDGNLTTQ